MNLTSRPGQTGLSCPVAEVVAVDQLGGSDLEGHVPSGCGTLVPLDRVSKGEGTGQGVGSSGLIGGSVPGLDLASRRRSGGSRRGSKSGDGLDHAVAYMIPCGLRTRGRG